MKINCWCYHVVRNKQRDLLLLLLFKKFSNHVSGLTGFNYIIKRFILCDKPLVCKILAKHLKNRLTMVKVECHVVRQSNSTRNRYAIRMMIIKMMYKVKYLHFKLTFFLRKQESLTDDNFLMWYSSESHRMRYKSRDEWDKFCYVILELFFGM